MNHPIARLAILSALTISLITGCAVNPTAPSAPAQSQYPVDIAGRVTIANQVTFGGSPLAHLSPFKFWIVQLSIKNKQSTPLSVNYSDWMIAPQSTNGYSIFPANPSLSVAATIPPGQNGQATLLFVVAGGLNPGGLNPSDFQMEYFVTMTLPDSRVGVSP